MHPLADSIFDVFKSREDATQWVVLVVGVMATLYVVMRPKWKRKRDPLERRPFAPVGLAQQRQVERDMNSLMVQMLDTARQMTAQLDTRAARLEVLLQEADQTLARLQSAPALSNHPAAPRELPAPTPAPRGTLNFGALAYAGAQRPQPDPTPRDDRPADPFPRDTYARDPIARDTPPHEITPRDRRPQDDHDDRDRRDPRPDLPPDPLENMPDPRHAEVYALADQGTTSHEIARRLGRPDGEVELILALRPHVSHS